MSNTYIYLLTNSGAESGSTTGWTANGGFTIRTTDPAPRTGTYYFMGGNQVRGAAWQNIPIVTNSANNDIDTGQATFHFTWYQAGFDATNDQGTVSIHFMNAAGAPISNIALPFVVASRNWDRRGFAGNLVPALTRTIRVQMNAVRNSGTNNDAYFDDLSEVVVAFGSDAANVTAEYVETASIVTSNEANLTSEYVETATLTTAGSTNITSEYVEVGAVPISLSNVTSEYLEVSSIVTSGYSNITSEYLETGALITQDKANVTAEYLEASANITYNDSKVFQLSVQVESPVPINNITKAHQLFIEGTTVGLDATSANVHRLYVEAIVLLQEIRPQVLVAGI